RCRHTISKCDWSSYLCSSDLRVLVVLVLSQLLGRLAAHGTGPFQAVLQFPLLIGEQADGGAPPAAADGRSAEVGGLHPEAGRDEIGSASCRESGMVTIGETKR